MRYRRLWLEHRDSLEIVPFSRVRVHDNHIDRGLIAVQEDLAHLIGGPYDDGPIPRGLVDSSAGPPSTDLRKLRSLSAPLVHARLGDHALEVIRGRAGRKRGGLGEGRPRIP